ncbi:lycopene cyclase domain-containing protein [Brachybacterium sp. NBEC-018]|uniref:lycopene cyclase domain-containing protein n=1 Tax=Brachybacterium sp. NBEC-018 TaxID=2996004 RepID=UPI002174DCFC|nr:lycopene cyclase domain-containing protein [Brachybacterium sp. NBEC-018]UVY84153.1 lycopene cyclase domain-containing protein [Brachybacterium sp. NBEC-018]
MIGGLYLLCLCVPLLGMGTLDARYRLVLGRAARPALAVLAVGTVYFLSWDLAAIAAGHYGLGRSPALSGLMLAPHLPVEELVFVVVLAYTTLVLHALVARALARRRAPSPAR